jgi:hypothetical protein
VTPLRRLPSDAGSVAAGNGTGIGDGTGKAPPTAGAVGTDGTRESGLGRADGVAGMEFTDDAENPVSPFAEAVPPETVTPAPALSAAVAASLSDTGDPPNGPAKALMADSVPPMAATPTAATSRRTSIGDLPAVDAHEAATTVAG